MPAHDREEDDSTNVEIEILPAEYEEIKHKPDVVLIDVREPHEYEISRMQGAILIPKDQVPAKLAELDPTKDYIIHCKSGARSLEVTQLLRGAGFKAHNLWGGINAYARQVDPNIPIY
jgi:sulfur-carrier protein adenylyltransferase/sulfurtransferase